MEGQMAAPGFWDNNDRAQKVLGWQAKYSLEDIMSTAWKWEQELKAGNTVFN